MNLNTFRDYCLNLKRVTEDTPFDETTLVFRIGRKIFALTDTDSLPFKCNLKCDPERAIELREKYGCITPGWHMNKKHWNTIEPDDSISTDLLEELITHSYKLVFKSLKKSERLRIESE